MTIVVGFHLAVCVFLVFVILLQPGKGDSGGIGFGGGSSSQSIFGSQGAGNFLTKTTSVCAIIFLFTSFVLTRARLKEHNASVISQEAGAPAAPTTPAAGAPATAPTSAGAKAEPAKPAESLPPAKK